MKKRLITIFLILWPATAYANVVWPALYTETKVSSVPIISISLFIEYWFFKWLFGVTDKRALLYTVCANLASGIIGLIARPLSGIAYELSLGMVVNLLFNWGTFNPVAWFFVPVFGGAVNAAIELKAIHLIGKEKITRKTFFLTMLINAVTIGLATLWVIQHPPRM